LTGTRECLDGLPSTVDAAGGSDAGRPAIQVHPDQLERTATDCGQTCTPVERCRQWWQLATEHFGKYHRARRRR
jgi:hypothetical protein